MKRGFPILIFIISVTQKVRSQSYYSLGIQTGAAVNIFSNSLETDRTHFKFTMPLSGSVGIKLLKHLDEKNAFVAEFTVARKEIKVRYSLSEENIPYSYQEFTSQKYSVLSGHLGYRRTFPSYTHQKFIELSGGVDFNSNTVSAGSGNGNGTAEELTEPLLYVSSAYTNLGEKTQTFSTNLGFGVNLGPRNQYELAVLVNIPFGSIQQNVSFVQQEWKYQQNTYLHSLEFLGKIYYPSVKLTYYVF